MKLNKDEKEKIANLVQLNDKAPSFFKKFTTEELRILYQMIYLVKCETIPSKPVHSGERVAMRVPLEMGLSIATKFNVVLDLCKNTKTNKLDRVDGDEVEELSWEITNRKQLQSFFSMFRNLELSTDTVWITCTKSRNRLARINEPSSKKWLFMNSKEDRDLKKYKEFLTEKGIKSPLRRRCKINVGTLKRNGQQYSFKISIIRDMDMSCLFKFSYSFCKTANGVAEDLIPEGVPASADPNSLSKKQLAEDDKRAEEEWFKKAYDELC